VRTLSAARYGFSAPNAITVAGGLVWVANEGDGDGRGGSVTELDAGDGGWVRTLSGARYGFNAPYSIASAHGRIWVTNLYPGIAGGSVTELNVGDGSWVATLTGGCYSFDRPHGIAVDGSHIWVANSGASQAGGSVTELNASNGGWIQTLSDGTWIQSLLRGCIPGVLASGGYHFSDPGLVAAVGPRIWVFGRDGVRVLADPAARPGRGGRP
jgi:DNA-binding beta-propeller fold protein YncE